MGPRSALVSASSLRALVLPSPRSLQPRLLHTSTVRPATNDSSTIDHAFLPSPLLFAPPPPRDWLNIPLTPDAPLRPSTSVWDTSVDEALPPSLRTTGSQISTAAHSSTFPAAPSSLGHERDDHGHGVVEELGRVIDGVERTVEAVGEALGLKASGQGFEVKGVEKEERMGMRSEEKEVGVLRSLWDDYRRG